MLINEKFRVTHHDSLSKKQFLIFQHLIKNACVCTKLIDLHLEMRLKQAYEMLVRSIHPLYENREAKSITDWVIEDITGWNRSGILAHEHDELDDLQEKKLEQYTLELKHGRPVQYVLSTAWFLGHPFFVDERVLIPRPETEELVNMVRQICHHQIEAQEKKSLIDIGTGSGCIAISLKKIFPTLEVWAVDCSEGALEVAEANAKKSDAEIKLSNYDVQNTLPNETLPVFDIIVSNPPYIPISDKEEMDPVVLNHEPHVALFVKGDDPLEFYRSILDFSNHHLLRGGMIFFETHSSYANEVANLMDSYDFDDIVVKKDMYGKDRIVYGKKSGASL